MRPVGKTMQKTIQISEEGLLEVGGVPLQDKDFGLHFLDSLHMKNHVCWGKNKDEEILVESRALPLVVQSVKKEDGDLVFTFNYNFQEKFNLETSPLFMDDWSRIRGFSQKGVPFVFSKVAQESFLKDCVESFDYNTFSFSGKSYEMDEWYREKPATVEKTFWSQRYGAQETPWDLGKPHPALDYVVPRLKIAKSKVIVPGCGKGHDAIRLAQMGHVVTGVDLSEEAVAFAKDQRSSAQFIAGDVFEYSKSQIESCDLVFEHTFFCALSPEERGRIVKTWKRLLRPGGYLMGVLMVSLKQEGPPFGITEWEVVELLEKDFKIDYWGRLRGNETARPGKELFVYAQRKN